MKDDPRDTAERRRAGVADTIPMEAVPGPRQSVWQGTRIAGKYRLDRILGRGTMSVVFEATHEMLERKAALKILSRSLRGDPAFEQSFEQEARLAASLEHPNIIKVYELGELDDHSPYIATELLDGEPLSERLEREGCLSIEQAFSVVEQVLEGLATAHQAQIVHRDLCPANVFLTRVRGGEQVKLLDFGISRRLDPDGRTSAPGESHLDAPGHLAPEQEGGERADQRADLYAVGVLLYEMLTGDLPQGAAAPSSKRDELGPDVDRLLEKALAVDPSERFQSAEEMRSACRLAVVFQAY